MIDVRVLDANGVAHSLGGAEDLAQARKTAKSHVHATDNMMGWVTGKYGVVFEDGSVMGLGWS